MIIIRTFFVDLSFVNFIHKLINFILKMKKIILFTLGMLLIISCSKEDPTNMTEQTLESLDTQRLLSTKEINSFIDAELKKGNQDIWRNASAQVLWSAAVQGNEVLSVGFGNKGESFSKNRSPRLLEIIENISNVVASNEKTTKSEAIRAADQILNVIDVNVTNLKTVEELLKLPGIRYIEPIGYAEYNKSLQKSAGCSQEGQNINGNDYRMISPNTQLPWNYDIHKIPQAWNYSTGSGITVGLIDTGLSANQNLLGSGFNDGVSSGRSVQRFGTYIDSIWWWSNNLDGPNDRCGHGTQMASAIASPRNDNGMPVGVAYNSNLVAYRGTSDVLLDDYHERKGVSNALRAMGDRSDVKIISMSIGWVFSIGNIKDAVRYAHSRGKLIIAAGGTSTSFTNFVGVIFPANMNETVAVTGLRDDGLRCSNCHDGSKIDFTLIMQRAGNSDRNVPVLGFNNGTRSYVGGSSVATAMTAGIAALVWARNPNMSREQVLDKLKRAGANYPNRNSKFGYGNIDALKAVQ